MLVVTTAASDRSLLTLAELRSAVGVSDNSRDADLVQLGARIDAAICTHCKIAAGGVTPPTLRLETLTETIRIQTVRDPRPRPKLILSRRPIVSVTSATEGDTELDVDDDIEINAAEGSLLRLDGDDNISNWYGAKIVVVYRAGWATVPDNLKLAATKFALDVWSEGKRESNLKRIKIEGISEREYWVPPTTDPLISEEVSALLRPFMNIAVR